MKDTILKNILNSLSGDNHEKELKANGIEYRINEAATLDSDLMKRYAFSLYKDKMEYIKTYLDNHYEPVENTSDKFTPIEFFDEDGVYSQSDKAIPMAVRVVEKNSTFYVQFRMEFVHI